jgi:hypothetical protein
MQSQGEHYLVCGNGSVKNKGKSIYNATTMPENNLLVPMLNDFQVCHPGEIRNRLRPS